MIFMAEHAKVTLICQENASNEQMKWTGSILLLFNSGFEQKLSMLVMECFVVAIRDHRSGRIAGPASCCLFWVSFLANTRRRVPDSCTKTQVTFSVTSLFSRKFSLPLAIPTTLKCKNRKPSKTIFPLLYNFYWLMPQVLMPAEHRV